MAELNLEIISPNGVLFKGLCHMAVVPAAEGDLGVMYGHEAFIASLREGKIQIFDDKQNVVKEIEVTTGGFAEVQNGEKLLVLVD